MTLASSAAQRRAYKLWQKIVGSIPRHFRGYKVHFATLRDTSIAWLSAQLRRGIVRPGCAAGGELGRLMGTLYERCDQIRRS